MKDRICIVAGIVAVLGGCVYAKQPSGADTTGNLAPLATDRAEPRLALVEHLLATYFSSDIASPPTVCAAVTDGRTEAALPTMQETALIERFAQLAPFSRCNWNGRSWRDSESEQPALVFMVHSFSCSSETRCSGWAGYTAGEISSPSSLYTMEYREGHWTFGRDRRLIAN